MKKAIFAGFAVLLALALVTCDAFPPAEESGEKPDVVYDENGVPWAVNLTVKIAGNTNGARSMTSVHDEEWSNYFEVAFLDSATGKYYTAKWRGLEPGRIMVPINDYPEIDPSNAAGDSSAILFAGQYATKSLLGVGRLTKVNGQTSTEITASTTNVTFELVPLNADVKASNTSSFQITKTSTGPSAGLEADNLLTSNFAPSGYQPITGVSTATTGSATIAITGAHPSIFHVNDELRIGTTEVKVLNVEEDNYVSSPYNASISSGVTIYITPDPTTTTPNIAPGDKLQIGGTEYIVDTGGVASGSVTVTVAPSPAISGPIAVNVWKIADTITLNGSVATAVGTTIERMQDGNFPRLKYTVNDKIEYIPLFYVETDPVAGGATVTTTATYTITGPAGHPTFASTFPHAAGVFVQTPKLFSEAFISKEYRSTGSFGIDNTTGGLKIGYDNGTTVDPIDDDVIPSDGVFTFEIPVKAKQAGLRWFAFDIPVRALQQSTTDYNESGDEWHIRSGIFNTDPDLGADSLNANLDLPGGGAILLGTQNVKIMGDIEIIVQ